MVLFRYQISSEKNRVARLNKKPDIQPVEKISIPKETPIDNEEKIHFSERERRDSITASPKLTKSST